MDPVRFEDDKPKKCMECEPIWALFQGFEPLFGSFLIRIRKVTSKIRIRIKVTIRIRIRPLQCDADPQQWSEYPRFFTFLVLYVSLTTTNPAIGSVTGSECRSKFQHTTQKHLGDLAFATETVSRKSVPGYLLRWAPESSRCDWFVGETQSRPTN